MGYIPYDFTDEQQRASLELIGCQMNCGLLLCSSLDKCRIHYINERFASYLGYSHSEFLKTFPCYLDCVYEEDRGYVRTTMESALEQSDSYELIYRVRCNDSKLVWIRENVQVVGEFNGCPLLMCVLVDISSDMAARQEIETKSMSDPLTKLLNRTAFREQVERLLEASPVNERKHAFIMLDIDHFKQINDTFGHVFGDKVIEDVAHTLRAVVRVGDLLGRLGGDEFMLCLKDIKTDETLKNRIEHMRSLLRKQLPSNMELSCSLGISIYSVNGEDFESLYRHADIALYEAKRKMSDRIVFFTPDMDTHDFSPSITPIENVEISQMFAAE